MKVAETRPDTERQQLISSVTADAAHLLNINLTEDPPKEVMNKVNDAIVALVFEQPTPITNDENPHLLLGCLWGAQMARQFNWYWADVVLDGEHYAQHSPYRTTLHPYTCELAAYRSSLRFTCPTGILKADPIEQRTHMPLVNRFADLLPEITEWRRDLHEHPELLFEVVEGIGRTGVVGVINGKNSNSDKVIGLRADMDALPIHETSGVEHASKTDGKMHACGHDGHTAMLLGAAKYLCETGMMDRFDIKEVYGMHNWPGMDVGKFAIRPGPLMAAADQFDIVITGKGGHAAAPHKVVDPTVIASQLMLSLQSVVSRNVDPLENAVVSVTSFNTDTVSYNVIPQTVSLKGTVRTLDADIQPGQWMLLHHLNTITVTRFQ